MTTVKSFALAALVLGLVAHSTSADAIRGNIRWQGWNRHGEIHPATPAPRINPPTPVPPPVVVIPVAPVIPPTPPAPAPIPAVAAPVNTANSQPGFFWSTGNPVPQPPASSPTPSHSVSFDPTTFAGSAIPSTTVSVGPIGVAAASSASSSAPVYDAFVNLTEGKFAEASSLINGAPQAWYNSPVVTAIYGGSPNAAQRGEFTAKVLADVQHTFDLAGVPVHLTTDPNAHAAHTLSVVSNATYSANPDTIGITDVGANGFDFIDKFTSAKTADDLALAVAHNVSHELMHAFGVAVHHDGTGQFIDAGSASWSLLSDPNATFSPGAIQELLSKSFSSLDAAGLLGAQNGPIIDGEQVFLAAQTVPEPMTIVLWLSVLGGVMVVRSRRSTGSK